MKATQRLNRLQIATLLVIRWNILIKQSMQTLRLDILKAVDKVVQLVFKESIKLEGLRMSRELVTTNVVFVRNLIYHILLCIHIKKINMGLLISNKDYLRQGEALADVGEEDLKRINQACPATGKILLRNLKFTMKMNI